MIYPNVFIFFVVQFFFLNFLTRFILTSKEWMQGAIYFIDTLSVLLNGFISDLFVFVYFIPFYFLVILLIPKKNKSLFKKCLLAAIFIHLFVLAWISISEFIFWGEFASRFNFVAVDYLIYTKEVVGNIKESFSMSLFLALSTVLALIGVFLSSKLLDLFIFKEKDQTVSFPKKLYFVFILPVLFYFIPSVPQMRQSNNISEELSKNGVYEFFSAYRHNHIDYELFYKKLPFEQVLSLMKNNLSEDGYELLASSQGNQWIKMPVNQNKKDSYNVVFVVVESLGANFLSAFGNTLNITPYLDSLKEKSLFFTNIYATGTRTVRGIEALTLGLPPTPGASIVRRPHNENLHSFGGILKKLDYDVKFIYGGFGLFDNMNYYFENNSYQIVDRSYFSSDEITFSNVWGVCDEDLFNMAIKEAQTSYSKGKKFHQFILTTSNHRPFTYPEGKIDIPSKTSREGAVKYTDYSIGKFLENSKDKPWFKDTIFVVVADHSAEGRGKIDIPVSTYHIPFIIYAPHIVKPSLITKVASQIDVIPTIMSLMGERIPNLFFGSNILSDKFTNERFFVGTYQSVGYYKNNHFVELSLKRKVSNYSYDPISKELKEADTNAELENEAISYYQYANYLYKNKMYVFDHLNYE